MSAPNARFEQETLPHLDAAYNLARHLLRTKEDAEDVVQEAYLRALRHYGTFRGANPRAWLLAIVRHTAYSRGRRLRMAALTAEFNEEIHSDAGDAGIPRELERSETASLVHRALDLLPARFREVLVLRELEELSYDDISRIVRVPVGTVMSRLSRARARLERALREGGEKAS